MEQALDDFELATWVMLEAYMKGERNDDALRVYERTKRNLKKALTEGTCWCGKNNA